MFFYIKAFFVQYKHFQSPLYDRSTENHVSKTSLS